MRDIFYAVMAIVIMILTGIVVARVSGPAAPIVMMLGVVLALGCLALPGERRP